MPSVCHQRRIFAESVWFIIFTRTAFARSGVKAMPVSRSSGETRHAPAAFSIANTLITTVIQKTKEVGLLKSMGAGSFSIMRVFIMQGFFVGIIGTAGGVFLGWLVVVFRMNILYAMRAITGQEIFPKELYLFSELPAHIVWGDVALISANGLAAPMKGGQTTLLEYLENAKKQ